MEKDVVATAESNSISEICGGCDAVNCNTGSGRKCLLKQQASATRIDRVTQKIKEGIRN